MKKQKILVIGCGQMGSGIAQTAAEHGHSVFLGDLNEEYVKQAIEKIHQRWNTAVDKGKKQKEEIAEIRKDYTAQIADRDVTMQDKVRKLSDRVPPEEIAESKRLLETQFREEKQSLEEEMEKEIESIRNSKG